MVFFSYKQSAASPQYFSIFPFYFVPPESHLCPPTSFTSLSLSGQHQFTWIPMAVSRRILFHKVWYLKKAFQTTDQPPCSDHSTKTVSETILQSHLLGSVDPARGLMVVLYTLLFAFYPLVSVLSGYSFTQVRSHTLKSKCIWLKLLLSRTFSSILSKSCLNPKTSFHFTVTDRQHISTIKSFKPLITRQYQPLFRILNVCVNEKTVHFWMYVFHGNLEAIETSRFRDLHFLTEALHLEETKEHLWTRL